MAAADDDRLPWERQRGETPKSFESFSVYLRQGPSRGLRRVMVELGAKSITRIKEWSARWDWVARAEAYDDDLQRRYRLLHEAALFEMADRHVAQSTLFTNKVVAFVQGMSEEKLRAMNPATAVRMWEAAVAIERSARGEPTHRIEHGGEVGTHDLTLERVISDPALMASANDFYDRLNPDAAYGEVGGERDDEPAVDAGASRPG